MTESFRDYFARTHGVRSGGSVARDVLVEQLSAHVGASLVFTRALGVFGSSRARERFERDVAAASIQPKIIDLVSSELSIPSPGETEDEFVARATRVYRAALERRFGL